MTNKQKMMLARILAAAALLAVLALVPTTGVLRFAGYMCAYLIVGWDILRKAGKGILNRRIFDENFLMAIATVGAIALALYEGSGDYLEAVAVMLFYQVGELFQSYAVGKSRRSISDLMNIRPDYAWVENEKGNLEKRDPDEVPIGTVVTVRPGEKIPMDGIVTSGSSSLNTSALTGESLPRDVETGMAVESGCINLTGVLKIRTTKGFGDSTASKVLDLVENASSRKAKSEEFISKFARWYTPLVFFGALALALLPPAYALAAGAVPGWDTWIYRALIFLVISCPCALVISVPLSFFAGLGGASREGVLIKGANYMETLANAAYVVFDKTGTLTKGVFEIVGIHHGTIPDEEILHYAAHAESASTHPISLSLQRAYGKALDRSAVTDIRELSGRGVVACVEGRVVAAGNEKLMREIGVEPVSCRSVGTIVHVAVDGAYVGHIVISDVVKPESKGAIAALKAAGVKETVMLTGDAPKTAEAVAAELGIDRVRAGLLPADKVNEVEAMLEKKPEGEKLAFVGDGINDAPVLARADVGIAMGAMGSDAAIEAADVVLMDDDPTKVAKAVRIARKCMTIVRENIVFAIGVKAICLVLGAVGLANMWMAIFADVGVMVLAILNSIRAMFVKEL